MWSVQAAVVSVGGLGAVSEVKTLRTCNAVDVGGSRPSACVTSFDSRAALPKSSSSAASQSQSSSKVGRSDEQ